MTARLPLTDGERAQFRRAAIYEGAYRKLSIFVRAFWREVDATPPVWGPHLEAVCDEIQATWEESDRRRAIGERISRSGIGAQRAGAAIEAELGSLPRLRLVILIPPRSGKSTVVGKLALAWRWLHRPQEQLLSISCADTLVERDGIRLRDVVSSASYRGLQEYLVRTGRLARVHTIRGDQHAKTKFYNSEGGARSGHPIGGAYTGVDADTIVIDDPHDVDDAFLGTPDQRAARMAEVADTYRDKVQDRLNSKLWGVIVLIMQRVHERDLAHEMISTGARVLCLPAEYDPDHPHRYAKDWRTRAGESIDPIRLPESLLAHMRTESPAGYAAKYAQRPSPVAGGLIQRRWLSQFWTGDWRDIGLDEVILSVDCTFKGGKTSDYVAIQALGRKGVRRYLLGQVHARMDYPATKAAVLGMVAEWRPTMVLVEDKANGSALIAELSASVPNLVPFDPGAKSKAERYQVGILPVAAAGNLWLPDPAEHPWVLGYVEELAAVPAGAHDDQADATAQALLHWMYGDTQGGWVEGCDYPDEEDSE